MDLVDEVILWKAPQRGRDATREMIVGFDADLYPGDGPYFALDKEVAMEFKKIYRNGLQEIHVPRALFEKLVQENIIIWDVFYAGRACYVPPNGLVEFNSAMQQGTPSRYHPEDPC